jgi:hypothetical protein
MTVLRTKVSTRNVYTMREHWPWLVARTIGRDRSTRELEQLRADLYRKDPLVREDVGDLRHKLDIR